MPHPNAIRSGECRSGNRTIYVDRKTADVNNVSSGGFAGSITCALFLKRFVSRAKAFAHFDIYAWDAVDEAGAAGRRRMPGGAGALRAPENALRLMP